MQAARQSTPQQLANDLTAYFNAASAPAPNGYVQSVTSVALPYGKGTALVGIGGDNAVYVNEQVAGDRHDRLGRPGRICSSRSP